MKNKTVISSLSELGVNGTMLEQIRIEVSFDLNKSIKDLTQTDIRQLFGLN